jgi:hypothetical protein
MSPTQLRALANRKENALNAKGKENFLIVKKAVLNNASGFVNNVMTKEDRLAEGKKRFGKREVK